MRLETRMTLWKLGTAAAALGAILAAMHFLLPALARRREQRLLGGQYQRVEAERLVLWVPRGTRLAEPLARDMAAFATALHAQWGEALALRPLEDRITVRLFTSQAELQDYARRAGMTQDLSHAIGFYDPRTWSIALTLRPREALLPLVFHETTHLLMDRPDRLLRTRWSPWVAEGLAVFFEHSTVKPDGALRLGGVDPAAARAILALARRDAHVPLRDLVLGGPELFGGPRAPLCYQEAGSLMAFLLQGDEGRHRDGFLRYYREAMQLGPRSREALEHHLGLPLPELERQWLDFLQRSAR